MTLANARGACSLPPSALRFAPACQALRDNEIRRRKRKEEHIGFGPVVRSSWPAGGMSDQGHNSLVQYPIPAMRV